MIRRRAWALVVVVCLAGVGLPAHASPWRVASAYAPPAGDAASGEAAVDPEAVAAYEAGSNAYALGNYAEAVTHFERAFELSHRSELLFNLGQAYSRWYEISGDLAHLKKGRKLLENYLSFLDEHPDQDDPEARRQTEERLAEVEQLIANQDGPPPETPQEDTKKPVHKKAWFWVVVVGGAAVVAGAVATAVVLSRRNQRDEFDPELGTLGRGIGPGGLGFRF